MFDPAPMLIVDMDLENPDVFDKLADAIDKQVERAMHKLVDEVKTLWEDKARAKLNRTLQKYLDGMSVDAHGMELQCALKGFVAVGIESGQAAYNMKAGMLGGKAKRVVPIGKADGENPIHFVTLRPDSKGWNHPGWEPKNILDDVRQEAKERLVPDIIGEFVARVTV